MYMSHNKIQHAPEPGRPKKEDEMFHSRHFNVDEVSKCNQTEHKAERNVFCASSELSFSENAISRHFIRTNNAATVPISWFCLGTRTTLIRSPFSSLETCYVNCPDQLLLLNWLAASIQLEALRWTRSVSDVTVWVTAVHGRLDKWRGAAVSRSTRACAVKIDALWGINQQRWKRRRRIFPTWSVSFPFFLFISPGEEARGTKCRRGAVFENDRSVCVHMQKG